MGGRRDLHSVRAIAAGQRGLITREQLLAAGVTRRVLDGLVADGWLQRVHTGVYAVGPPGDRRAALLAATLALGPTAAASDRSAAELWDVLEPRGRALHVTLPTRDGLPARDAIVVHRRELRPDERTRRAGVPCTTLARTLFDLAAGERRVFARAFEEAQVTHGFRPAVLAAAMLARPGHRGARAVRSLLADAVDPGEVESVLELRFLAFCAAQGLSRPRTQVRVGSWRADFCFPAGVVVKTDGGRFHATAARRARDARKTAALEASGLRVLRVTWRELHERPGALAERIRVALAVASSPASGDQATFGSV